MTGVAPGGYIDAGCGPEETVAAENAGSATGGATPDNGGAGKEAGAGGREVIGGGGTAGPMPGPIALSCLYHHDK